MFRYLIYRTDFGNTIVRESIASSATGGTEQEIFTDFVIPEIQPLFLWRVTGATSVVPNTEQNIDDWVDSITPVLPDDPVTNAVFSAYTGQTQLYIDYLSGQTSGNTVDIQFLSGATDGKLDKVSGATTGNVPIFGSSGNTLVDSGFDIADLTGATSGVTVTEFNTYTAQTANDLSFISGATDTNSADIQYLSGETSGNTQAILDNDADIAYISGVTDTKLDTSSFTGFSATTDTRLDSLETSVSGLTGNTFVTTDTFTGYTATTQISIDNIEDDILYLSGETSGNTQAILDNDADIAYISGVTDTKQDQLTADEGINVGQLANDVIRVDLSSFTAIGGINITLTGSTNAIIDDLRSIASGLEYNADYAANFVDRSLVDKGYVDSVAAGLDLKESVVVATTTGDTNIDLTLGTFGGTIDGYSIVDGDRVLVKNQVSAPEDNGIYIYSTGSNTFARAVDFVDPNVTAGAFTFVETGDTNAGSGWVLVTPDPITIGTTPLTFTQFSEAGQLQEGTGIDISGQVISVDGASLAGNFIQWTGTQFNVTGLTTVADFNVYTAATAADISFLSGATDINIADISYISGVTDQNFAEFTGYTATTQTSIDDIENDINFLSAQTSGNTADIQYLSGVTDTKLDTSIFTGYTATTQSNELFLVHTGGTELNTVLTTAIVWNSGVTVGSAYSFTGSTIEILETGTYELTYNIPFNQNGGNNDRGIGGNIVLNNTDVIDTTASAGFVSRNNAAGSVTLGTINLSLTSGDNLDLVCFRTAQSGSVVSSKDGTILIKKKNTLQ